MNIGICAANEVGYELLDFVIDAQDWLDFNISYVVTAELLPLLKKKVLNL